MPYKTPSYSFIDLKNPDQALKIILLMLIRDKNYQMLPMRQILTFYKSIRRNNYILMIVDGNPVAVLMWMYVNIEVRDECLLQDRSPHIGELCGNGDALYCTAFTGLNPSFLLPLWRHFSYTYRDQDILLKRHFKNGAPKHKPITLVRNQKIVRKGEIHESK